VVNWDPNQTMDEMMVGPDCSEVVGVVEERNMVNEVGLVGC
jgi:hypothetical protein